MIHLCQWNLPDASKLHQWRCQPLLVGGYHKKQTQHWNTLTHIHKNSHWILTHRGAHAQAYKKGGHSPLNTWASLGDHLYTLGQRDVQQDQQRAGRSHLPPRPHSLKEKDGKRERERKRVISPCLYMRSSTSLLLLDKTSVSVEGCSVTVQTPQQVSTHTFVQTFACPHPHRDTHLDTHINIPFCTFPRGVFLVMIFSHDCNWDGLS